MHCPEYTRENENLLVVKDLKSHISWKGNSVVVNLLTQWEKGNFYW